MRTNVGLLTSSRDWWLAALILVVAVLGKLFGTAVAARASGILWREANALGVLLNSRGLMEWMLLTISLRDGIITPTLFTMMVISPILAVRSLKPGGFGNPRS